MVVRSILCKNLKKTRCVFNNCHLGRTVYSYGSVYSSSDLIAAFHGSNLRFLSSLHSAYSVSSKRCEFFMPRDGNFLVRNYCSGKSGQESNEWTGEIEYLDESGSVIYSGKGIRSVEPGVDDHVMWGGLKKPISNAEAVAKIVEIVKRWKWGPDMETQLDRLQFFPSMTHILQSLKVLGDGDSSLGLFRWAKRQSWYSPSDECYITLLERLEKGSDYDGIQSVFDDMVRDSGENGMSSFSAYNRVIQSLAKAEKLEVTFCCFKKMKEIGCNVDTPTYNSLINLFLDKGLPYKAFEIYESMEAAGCSLDASTYELMIPNLAKSGRLDAANKLFLEMKGKNFQPGYGVFSALIDSMGKAGRLDTALKVYMEMQGFGLRPSASMFVSLIESFVKAGKLDTATRLWDEMKKARFRPNYSLYTMMVESHAKSGKLETAMTLFTDMECAGYFPMPSTYSSLLEMHAAAGHVDAAMKLYNSMTNAGLRPGLSSYTALLTLLAKKKLVDIAAKVLLEMKAMGYSVDVSASDVLMVYIKDGSVDLSLRWLRFMGSSGIRTNNFIIRQLFESCMKSGLYESAKPLLETYVNAAAKVDLVLYTSILAYLVRCQEEHNERHLMAILSATKHKAHAFMCGLFTGPEQRMKPVLTFVREFFQGIDYELEEGAARYFVNVLLNYLVLMGQINRARCVWKVAYENKLFPKAIVFDQHIAWSLDVRNLSVGAALIAVVHTLHRFRKRMLYYGVVPRRIKLVTGPTLKIVIAQMLNSVESPFEVSKVVLRAPGDSVLEWFKKPIVQQFLLNEIPSSALKELRTKHWHGRISASHDLNRNPDRSPDPEPETGARQVLLNGNNVVDIKQEDVVAVLDLPRGPKPVEEFKQNDLAITDHAEMVDAFKKRMGYSNKFLPTRSTAAQLIASRKDFDDDFKRDFLVFVVSTFLHGNTTSRITMNILKSLVNMNEDLAALYEKFYQLIITMSKTALDICEKEMELKIEPDEQAKQTIKILTDAMVSMTHGTNISTTKKKRSHQDSTSRDSGVTSTYTRRTRSTGTKKRKVFKDPTIPHFGLGIFFSQEDSYETTQEKNTEKDITGSVDLDKNIDETIEAEEYPVPSTLNETKNPTPSIDKIIRRANAPASKSLSDTKKLEMIATAAEEVEKNSKVVEVVPISIIPPDWNIASTTGGLLMLEKNECTTPPPAISKKADELDEELTKTVEKILNEKPKRRNPARVRRLPERFRPLFMLQKKNKKKFIQWTEEKKKMTQEEALLIDFALFQKEEEIVKIRETLV
ncbi:OLC1v1036303C1 [Oldenlandia corymbosa var. corymbosa]|uniref:OLC1v1036303C1 n=1 Tax=Oldenlandia corymbosa var. corymbosa TaxID=529605 RepID=A0AAV1CUY6_OLDCO|nr:OLC1v1036303C1 [Oldenlandia corymbosa var. corymbosa]